MKSSYYALHEFGSAFLGPAFNSYSRAIYSLIDDKPDRLLPVCLAREGWSIHRLLTRTIDVFDSSLPSPVYLKVSRTILFKALLGEKIVYDHALTNDYSGSLLSLLNKRFGLANDDVFELFKPETLSSLIHLPQDKDKVEGILRSVEENLLELVHPTRIALINYLAQEGLSKENVTAVMLDLGYSGTIQKLLTFLLKKDTEGLYFIASKSGSTVVGKNTAYMNGVFHNDVKWGEDCIMLERSLFFESLMTAPHGQVIDICEMADGSFEFIYGRETSTQYYFQDLKAVIDGGISATKAGIKNGISYSPDEVSALYSVFAKTSGALPASVSHLFNVEDDFSGNGVVDAKQLFRL